MSRDAEATRRRILEAATAEFAQHGLAGGRVDRIAAEAGSNKQLIYQYFGSKEGLFRTVVAQELARAIDGVDFPDDDLAQYAGAYFDFAMANPRLMRLVAWCGLEIEGGIAGVPEPGPKLARVAEAQARGNVSDRFSPAFILATISAICMAWVPNNWYANLLDPEAASHAPQHREAVVRLVTMMIRPDPKP